MLQRLSCCQPLEVGERIAGIVKAAQAGVTIGFGTDAGSPVVPHSVVAPELEFMIKLGVKKNAL